MKTRTAQPGSPLRQERYASSPCFEQGLMANHVARRCTLVKSPDERAALWFIQWRSWQPGGLELLAQELLDNCGSAEFGMVMNRHRVEPGHGYPFEPSAPEYRLKRSLEDFCLNPVSDLISLFITVSNYRAKWIAQRSKEVVQTEIGKRIEDALDYAYEARTLTIIDGDPRLGKSFAAKHHCEISGGLLRYVQVPSSTDLASFLRAIAESLGLATNLNLKAQVLHHRIRDALASGDLGICFDEAHYAWPQGRLRCAVPARVNWIMTTLCNEGIASALVTTPQFYTAQSQLEKQTAWSSAQFIGRVGHVERLPDKLCAADLRKVAAFILPSADERTIAALAAYAAESKKHLASIEAIAKRASWLASKAGRSEAGTDDVKRAMKESVIPSDVTLAKSLTEAPKAAPRARRGGFAARPRPLGGITANSFSRSSAPALV
jgi:hypothetical protein